MPFKTVWLGSDLACVSVINYAPENVVATVLTSFTFDVILSGATITSVNVDPGDGGGSAAASLVSGDEWTVDHTYAAAGAFNAVVTVVDSNGETHTFTAPIVVAV